MVFGTACRPTGSGASSLRTLRLGMPAYARFGATRRPTDNGSLFGRLNSQTFSELALYHLKECLIRMVSPLGSLETQFRGVASKLGFGVLPRPPFLEPRLREAVRYGSNFL